MNKSFVRFLVGLLIWGALVLIPLIFLFIRASRPLRVDDLNLMGPIVLLGIVVVSACCSAAPKVPGNAAVLLGIAFGVIFPVFGGFILARALGGFELSAALFSGALLLAAPSGIGGGVVGWLNRRVAGP